MAGKVWLVGAGPADGGLLTLKGKAVLDQAEVVVYDALVGGEILAWIPPRRRKSTWENEPAVTGRHRSRSTKFYEPRRGKESGWSG